MTDSDDEPDDPEWIKLGAKHEADFLFSIRDKYVDQTLSMGRWLLASLLAINGGGALATLNSADKLTDAAVPGGLFVAGIIFALLNGLFIQSPGAYLKRINEVAGYWLFVAHDGERVPDFESQHKALGKAMSRRSTLQSLPGWLSAALFLAGSIALAQSVPIAQPAPRSELTRAAKADATIRPPEIIRPPP